MKRHRRTPLLASLVLAACLASAPATAAVMPTDGMHGLGTVERHQLEALGTTYTLLVRLPDAIANGADEDDETGKLPVVYLLDGGYTFPTLGGYHGYLRITGEVPDLVLVGISYGTSEQPANQRSRDFTAPSADVDYYGGIGPFLDFLETEVFPLIEARYPADPKRRVLFGQSLGGQAAIWAALHRPGLFWGHVASNPALHDNPEHFLNVRPAIESDDTEPPPRPLLFVASGSDDTPRWREPALGWIEHWRDREHPWRLEARTLPGHSHVSMGPAAYRDGLRWLFAEP